MGSAAFEANGQGYFAFAIDGGLTDPPIITLYPNFGPRLGTAAGGLNAYGDTGVRDLNGGEHFAGLYWRGTCADPSTVTITLTRSDVVVTAGQAAP